MKTGKADSKSKPPDASGATSASIYLQEVLSEECRKYELFHGWNPGDATEKVVDRSSLTVAGWADAVVNDWDDIDAERGEFERALN